MTHGNQLGFRLSQCAFCPVPVATGKKEFQIFNEVILLFSIRHFPPGPFTLRNYILRLTKYLGLSLHPLDATELVWTQSHSKAKARVISNNDS